MVERSKYFVHYIVSSLAGLALIALGCGVCCGGCVPWPANPQPDGIEKVEP